MHFLFNQPSFLVFYFLLPEASPKITNEFINIRN